jgi:TonB-linked outer membrane protein, SusC/RagA family
MLTLFLMLSATGYGQTITLSEKNSSLLKVLQSVKKQSGYSFIYQDQLMQKSKPVDIVLKKVKLEDALKAIFLQQPALTYEIINSKLISIKEKRYAPQRPSADADTGTISVRGKVIDSLGNPIEGVSIQVTGTSTYALSDNAGNFIIKVPAPSAKLLFTHVSYAKKELTARVLAANANVVMQFPQTTLEDMIVIGYGQVKRSDVTGSVAKVDMDDVEKAPVRSFEEALAGRAAGVQVTSPDGQPGAASDIIIRGANSLTQDNSPLYVIDGFPIENPDNNALNPAEIESIDILKDASATAIYGARGANGVIIITTKKGKAGKAVVTLNGYAGVQANIKRMKLLSGYEFIKLQTELNPAVANKFYFTDGKTLDSYKDQQGIDWQDRLFRTAPMQNYFASISGGTTKSKYFLSGSIFNQDGIVINTGFKRYQGRAVLDQQVGDKLKTGVNINFTNATKFGTVVSDYRNDLSSLSLLYSVWAYRPISGTGNDEELANELYDDAIDMASDYRSNPIITAQNIYNKNITATIIANAYGEYAITPRLKLRITGGLNRANSRSEIFNNSNTPYGNPRSTLGKGGPNGTIINTQIDNLVNENTLTYQTKWGQSHTLNALAGYTIQVRKVNSSGASALLVPNESLGISGLDEGVPSTIRSTTSESVLLSYLARVNYSFKSKYMLTATFRADGSSRFAPGNKWSYFPSGAFAWRLSNEPFMKNITVITDAKLRIGYGITGNNRVTDFAYLSVLSFPNINSYAFNNSLEKAAIKSSLDNYNLKWENTGQFDVGIDLSFFNNRVGFVADFYHKNTYDLLLNADMPVTTGLTKAFKNIGRVRNSGFEFSLNTINVQSKNFSWRSGFNISFNASKVLELTQNQESILTAVTWENNFKNIPLYMAKLGQPVALLYGYVWEGVYQYEDFIQQPNGTYLLKDEVATNGNTRTAIKPGDIKYRDLNGDRIMDINDQTAIGRPFPIHTGGFTNNITWKNFDLNIFLQWSYGNDVFNANRLLFEGNINGRLNQNQFASYADRWSPENPNSKNFRPNGQGPAAYSSRVVEDGSYLRVKTVSIGYNLPATLIKKARIHTMRCYISAQNLYTITGYSGTDPEVSTRNSALTPAFDYSAYPRAFTIIGGINLTL